MFLSAREEQRNHPAALSPRIKSLNYLNNILAKIEGLQAGCIEALMLNHKGEIAECTGDNCFLVRRGILFTPPLEAGILGGNFLKNYRMTFDFQNSKVNFTSVVPEK